MSPVGISIGCRSVGANRRGIVRRAIESDAWARGSTAVEAKGVEGQRKIGVGWEVEEVVKEANSKLKHNVHRFNSAAACIQCIN